MTEAWLGRRSAATAFLVRGSPSLVLLDLVMPDPDGYADPPRHRCVRVPPCATIPVVVLTALDAEDEVTRAFAAGADDFVRKPFRPTELVARIRGQTPDP